MSELKVLIVDDEAPARARMRELLGDIRDEVPNVVVGEAENGVAAIAQLDAAIPDVVLADIRMPKMDGLELVREIRRKHRRGLAGIKQVGLQSRSGGALQLQ